MPSTYVDLSELFENLPPEGAQRSAIQNSGFCWFNPPEDYPDTAAIEKYVKAADVPVDDKTDDEFEKACSNAFFDMRAGGAGEGDHGMEVANVTWAYQYSVAPHQAERRYALETMPRDMLFVGSGTLQHVTALLELVTGLALLKDFGIDLGLFGSGPWNFELLHADTSEVLLRMVTARQAEYAGGELWMACAHYMDGEMNYAVFHAEDASGVLELMFSMPFLTPKPHAGQSYRALLFWRDGSTDQTIPWRTE